MSALTDFLQFMDGARMVILSSCNSCGTIYFACWHGGATVNLGLVNATQCEWFDCWTDYDLPEQDTPLAQAALRKNLMKTIICCLALDQAGAA